MAKVLVSNHTERKIHINIPHDAKVDGRQYVQPEPIIVPAGQTVPDGNTTKFVPGKLEVEDVHLRLVKDHPVIKHYFEEGHLRVPKSDKPQQQGGNGNQGGGNNNQNQK
jgi:hypothetical protein